MKTSFLDRTSWVEISNLLFGGLPLWVQRCLLWVRRTHTPRPQASSFSFPCGFSSFAGVDARAYPNPSIRRFVCHFTVALLECIMVSNKKNRKFISFKKWNKCCSGIRCVTIGGRGERRTIHRLLGWLFIYVTPNRTPLSFSSSLAFLANLLTDCLFSTPPPNSPFFFSLQLTCL